MNCRPGDLAFIVSVGEILPLCAREALHRAAIGRVVRTVHLTPPSDGSDVPCWMLEEPFSVPYGDDGTLIYCWGIADRGLRPIRDPGEDAVDEMIQLVGSPTVTVEYTS